MVTLILLLAEIFWCFVCSCFAIPLISTAVVRSLSPSAMFVLVCTFYHEAIYYLCIFVHENVSFVYLVVLIVLMPCNYAMFPASNGDVRTCKRS